MVTYAFNSLHDSWKMLHSKVTKIFSVKGPEGQVPISWVVAQCNNVELH